MILPTKPSYAGYRFPPEVISHAIWLYFRFPLIPTALVFDLFGLDPSAVRQR